MTTQTHFTSDIVNLNVGGTRFSTSRQTLCSVQDSFFSSLLSGRIPSCRDEHGHIFIDRDPKHFSLILNFLRTKELNLCEAVDVAALRSEAEFYAITPLVKRLMLCEDLDRSLCGDVLFTGFIPSPLFLTNRFTNLNDLPLTNQTPLTTNSTSSITTTQQPTAAATSTVTNPTLKPGNVLRLFNTAAGTGIVKQTDQQSSPASGIGSHSGSFQANASNPTNNANSKFMTHSRQSSNEPVLNFVYNYPSAGDFANQHYHTTMMSQGGQSQQQQQQQRTHSRNTSMDLKQMKSDLGILLSEQCHSGGSGSGSSVHQVNVIVGHHNWIAVAYAHYVCCYKLKDGMGWQMVIFYLKTYCIEFFSLLSLQFSFDINCL
jgi:hypothetical protein